MLLNKESEEEIIQSRAAKRGCGSVQHGIVLTHTFALWAFRFTFIKKSSRYYWQRHRCVWCRHVVQRRRSVTGGGDTAVLARCSDCGLAVCVLLVRATVWDQGVGAGQRAARVTHQAGEVGRWVTVGRIT